MASPSMRTPFSPEFDTLVQKTLDRFHSPGLSISVCNDSRILCKGYGNAKLNPSVPATPDTLFYAASTTKAQLCAVWALYIASDANQKQPAAERISWTTPLAKIIPGDFVLVDAARTQAITLEDAVSHRTGMSAHDATYGRPGAETPKEVTRLLRHLPLNHELRTTHEYCNTMYVAASHALEIVTGKPLVELLREFLWKPLGMEHTYGGMGEAKRAKGETIGKLYSWTKLLGSKDEMEGEFVLENSPDLGEIAGAGYVVSSAEDYGRWMRCLLSPGKGNVFNDEILKDLWKSRAICDEDSPPFQGVGTYALGWFVRSYRGHQLYWHPGGVLGGGSIVMVVPDIKWGVTFLGNGDFFNDAVRGLAFELLDAALGVPEADRYAREKADTHAVESIRRLAQKASKGVKGVYPNAPSHLSPMYVPPTLSVSNYAGTYTHAAYGSLTFDVETDKQGNDSLTCEIARTFPPVMTLEHVNAEYWLLTTQMAKTTYKFIGKAETRIGVDGKASELGLAMESSMPDTLIWFTRET